MVRLFLLRYFEAYFRHRWLYLLPIVILIGAAVVYFLTLRPTFSASGILYVNNSSLLTSLSTIQNNDINWWITPAQATSNELNELLQTDAFVRAVIKETDLEEFMDDGTERVDEIILGVRRGFWVNPVGNNQLYINATTEYPEISYQLVPALLNSYIFWLLNADRQESEVAQSFFRDLIDKYSAQLEAARQRITDYYTAHPAPLRGDRPEGERQEIESMQNEINLVSNRLYNALEKEENASLALVQAESDTRQTYVLVDAPRVPNKPDLSKRKMALQFATFIGVGIALSLIAVLGATVLDRSFRFPIDVETHLHLAVLAANIDVSPRKKWYQRMVPDILRRKKSTTIEEKREDLDVNRVENEINLEIEHLEMR